MQKKIVKELMDLLKISHNGEIKEVHRVMIIGAVNEALVKAHKFDIIQELLWKK